MECWNYASDTPNLHAQLLPLALFSVICYPFGIMMLFITIFIRHRHILKQRGQGLMDSARHVTHFEP